MVSKDKKTDEYAGEELSVFVASTLRAITTGLVNAKGDASGPSAHGTGLYSYGPPREVSFDIAVTARRASSKEGGLKLEVFSVGANGSLDATRENSTVSRISFTIPNHFKSNESSASD